MKTPQASIASHSAIFGEVHILKMGLLKRNMCKALFFFVSLAAATAFSAPVDVKQDGDITTLANEKVTLRVDLANRNFSVKDNASNEVVIDNAMMAADGWGVNRKMTKWKGWKATQTLADVNDGFGKGKRIVLTFSNSPFPAAPSYTFSYTLYEGQGAVVMGFGMKNTTGVDLRLMEAGPMVAAELFPGKKMEMEISLNGSAGAEPAAVLPGVNRKSANSLMVTGTVDGRRRTVVWGGLANKEFGKWVALSDNIIEMRAKDPVGRLVDHGQEYFSDDTFYLDVSTDDPFLALERYGRAMRLANNAKPNVYDFPVLCGWGGGGLKQAPQRQSIAEAGCRAGGSSKSRPDKIYKSRHPSGARCLLL